MLPPCHVCVSSHSPEIFDYLASLIGCVWLCVRVSCDGLTSLAGCAPALCSSLIGHALLAVFKREELPVCPQGLP